MNQLQKETFAKELAEILNDTDALSLYFNFVEKYPESLLREVLAKTLAIPDEKIRKTRGALFNYLIKQHDKTSRHYPRH